MLWNVHGLTKSKLQDPSFLQIFDPYHILILIETWTKPNDNTALRGFKEFPAHRLNTKPSARRAYGGVIVYIKFELLEGVSLLKCDSDKIWLKFDKLFFGLNNDVLLCACYVIPSNSSAQANIDIDMFEYLADDICHFKRDFPEACYLIAGDMNGRTAGLNDFIDIDNSMYLPLPADYDEDNDPPAVRVNEDRIVNSHGRSIIELCKMCNIRIVNGRVNPDGIRGGKFTCITHRGCSAVDYLLCSAEYIDIVKHFEVLETDIFSDHRPICFEIEYVCNDTNLETHVLTEKMIWNNDKKDIFVEKLNSPSTTEMFDAMVELIEQQGIQNCVEHVNQVLNTFVDALRNVTDDLFYRKFDSQASKINEKPIWADDNWLPLKKNFLRSRDKYNRNQSDSNRVNMTEARKSYRAYINQRRVYHENHQTKKLLEAKLSNIKLYWRLLKNPTKKDISYRISNHEFREYFMRLSDPGDEFFTPDEAVTQDLADLMADDLECAFHELNCDISEDEIKKAIIALKSGKSGGEDLILNEFFIHGREFLIPYLHKLFNFIFNVGIFPDAWSEGLLVPLHKKGSVTLPDNFRGITLLSTLGKLFTRVLNNRYNSWAEAYRIYVEAQYGFRSGRGTVDCIFILHNAITHFINNGQVLYTFFVDFSKAFDRVVYDNLWFKMLKLGISGKILSIVQSMYECVKTKVFTSGIKSEPFYCTLGVRQGECLSPFLFSMYINDLEEKLSIPDSGIDIGYMRLLLLMYADDVVIFAKSAELLQNEIDELRAYCEKWKLRINLDKSKVVVFRKGTRLPRPQWTYGDLVLKVTNKIHYLGVIFTSNGLFTQAQKTLADQATKGVFTFNKRLESFRNIKPSAIIDLFDKFISPILNYASEVWGFHKAKDIEQVHLSFNKRLLGIRKSAQNDFVYGELGRFPMEIIRYWRIIKYWLKIVTGQKSPLVNAVYVDSVNNIDRNTSYTWTRAVRQLLFKCGFGEVWFNQGVGSIECFYVVFRNRVCDIFKQEWHERIENSSRADFYRAYKRNFEFAAYLNLIESKEKRIALTRLLTSAHRLRIETGRWELPNPPPRHQRLCLVCRKMDDEYHFILECSILQDLRLQLIPRYYWQHPSMHKLLELVNSDNIALLNKLSEFSRKGFTLKQHNVYYPRFLSILSFITIPFIH